MKVVFGVKPGMYKNGKSALEVANYIEQHYGLFQAYLDMYEKKIAKEVTEILAQQVGAGKIEEFTVMRLATDRFKRALKNRRFDGKIAGVPTRASLSNAGRSKKKKVGGKHKSGKVMVYKRKAGKSFSIPVMKKSPQGLRTSKAVQGTRSGGLDFITAVKAVKTRPSFIDTGLYMRSMQVVLVR